MNGRHAKSAAALAHEYTTRRLAFKWQVPVILAVDQGSQSHEEVNVALVTGTVSFGSDELLILIYLVVLKMV